MNPYGAQDNGSEYINRTGYQSWFIVTMSFLVPATAMLATHAIFLRAKLRDELQDTEKVKKGERFFER